MTTVIHDTSIVTADGNRSIQREAAITIENDLIAAIGPSGEVLPRFPHAELMDGRGKVVMPGFANCHTHLVRTLARGIFEDQTAPNKPPFTRKEKLRFPTLSAEERRVAALLGAVEALRSGTTAAMDVAVGIEDYAQSMLDSGLRLVLAEQASDRAEGIRVGEPGLFEADPKLAEKGLQRIDDLYAKWHGAGDGRITVGVAAHAPDMVSPDLLHALRDLQGRLDVISTIHLNQYWGEVETIRQTHGLLPTEYLARHDFLNDRLVAAHCRCMTSDEQRILGASGAAVSFNPVAAARYGDSPQIVDLEAAGCRIVLGTDEFSEDMVQAVRAAVLVERVRLGEGGRPTPEEAIEWATADGYRALDLSGAGFLREGNKADLIVINTEQVHLTPRTHFVPTFVYQGQGRDVESVMVDGRWLMRDGKVLTMNEKEIINEANRLAQRVWHKHLP